MFSIWKLLRKIQRIRIRGPFICHMPLTIWTWNFSPPVICLTQVQNREYIPGWTFPSPISCSHTFVTPGTAYCHVMLCDALFALYLLFLPPLLSDRPRDRCRPCDRLRRRWPLLARATRQAPPLIIPISPIPFYHACIRFCYCYCLLLFWCIARLLLPYLLS